LENVKVVIKRTLFEYATQLVVHRTVHRLALVHSLTGTHASDECDQCEDMSQ